MKNYPRFSVVLASLASMVLVTPLAMADMGGGSTREESAQSDADIVSADKAIKAKNWNKAVEHLNKAAARDGNNADLYNKLGYSERKRGNLNAAFKHYERALAIDPKHRGAHEYIGEAYLMSGNLAKAEEHLVRLDKLCTFSCEEYRDLKAAITEYKQKRSAGK